MKDHHDASSSFEVEDVEGKVDASHSTVPGYVPDTEEEKKLVRKIDLYILPMMWYVLVLIPATHSRLISVGSCTS
jgi:hypothetical protein